MIKSFYLNKIVYYWGAAAAVIFAASYFLPILYSAGFVLLLLPAIAILADSLLLFGKKQALTARREAAERFSIGDANTVVLNLTNQHSFRVHASVIDELPVQFQERNWIRKLQLPAGGSNRLQYQLTPLSRGEYTFNDINVYVHGPLKLVKRRYIFPAKQVVKVYPSYVQMRKYQLLAVSNRLQQAGVKRLRKLGHSMEFEQIKEYVRGDDYRTINWKATARKDMLMVNNFTDERSQQIYCLINKGRVMKMPFHGMTLLDYSINAALALTSVALVRQDRAGLVCFEKDIDCFLAADKKPGQINQMMELLYRQQTQYLEPDFEKLFSLIRNRVTNRSLLVLFTNFESLESLQRELPALKRMSRYHLLLVLFFENTELKALLNRPGHSLEDIYTKTIAEKFIYEKKQMVRELRKNGILSVLTSPEMLTVSAINKYLELKTRLSI